MAAVRQPQGGKCENKKKKKSEKWNRLSSKVAVTNSQMEGKRFCDGFQCVAAWALSHQQQELRQLSLWPSVSHSPQHRQRTWWRWKGLAQREEGEDSLLGTPKTLCTDDNRVSQTKAQVRPFASSFFYLSIVVFFGSQLKQLTTSNSRPFWKRNESCSLAGKHNAESTVKKKPIVLLWYYDHRC